MSTDIEPYQPRGEIVARDVVDGWTGVMSDVVKLADYISQTEFIPKPLRGRPAAIAAAILAGREAGIPPLRALSHIHVIEGRPSMSAEQKRALALAAGHEIVYVETTTERCIVKGRRAGSDQWSTVTWTKDDAKAAGLLGKDNWRKWPRRMLQARATGELADMLFADATAGLATTEELVDDSDSTGIGSDGHTPARRTAQRRTAVTAVTAAPAAQDDAGPPEPTPAAVLPALPGEAGYDDPTPAAAPPQPQSITSPQKAKLLATFTHIGVKDRDERLRLSSAIVNRTLLSANDLTKDDASALIDTLERAAGTNDPRLYLDQLLAAVEGELVDDEAVTEP